MCDITSYYKLIGDKSLRGIFICCVVLLGAIASLSAQEDDRSWVKAIKYTADQIDFSRETNQIIGQGHVKVEYKDVVLTADKIVIDMNKKQAFADGQAKLKKGDKVTMGDNLIYDFVTKKTNVDNTHMEMPPWFAWGASLERHPEGAVVIHGAECSTCNLAKPHWRLETKELLIYPNDKIVAKNVVVYIGKIPVFYWPYYAHSLKHRRGKFFLVPGCNSDWGTYVLSGYRYGIGDHQHGEALVDYRHKRGFAYGLDHKYNTRDVKGLARVYYVNERDETSHTVREDDRYRFKWIHRQQFSDELWSVVEWHKLSDASVIQEYIEKEFENNPEPESYVYTQYDMPRSAASVLLKQKTNKFFDTVEYAPQIRYHTNPINISRLPLYWKTEVEYANINKDSVTSNNSTNRIDILQELSYARRWGFVGVKPYIGTRQTYYSHNLEHDESEFRGAVLGGVTFNTKLYKSLDYHSEVLDINGLRIVHEPSIEYRYQGEPTLLSEKIEQFDSKDDVNYENFFQIRLENRLQTRRRKPSGAQNWNLIQHRLYINYHPRGLEWGDAKRDLSEIYQELEIQPWDWLSLDIETIFDPYEKRYNEIEADLVYTNTDKEYSVSLGHHYLRDRNDEISTKVRFKAMDKWRFLIRNDYNFETNHMSRQEYTVLRDLHCWTSAFTYVKKRDESGFENALWLTFQLKAFDHNY